MAAAKLTMRLLNHACTYDAAPPCCTAKERDLESLLDNFGARENGENGDRRDVFLILSAQASACYIYYGKGTTKILLDTVYSSMVI